MDATAAGYRYPIANEERFPNAGLVQDTLRFMMSLIGRDYAEVLHKCAALDKSEFNELVRQALQTTGLLNHLARGDMPFDMKLYIWARGDKFAGLTDLLFYEAWECLDRGNKPQRCLATQVSH